MVGYNKKRVRPVTPDEFFEQNSGKYSYKEFAEKVYVMIHSYYFAVSGKIKVEMGKTWDAEFGLYMTDETFEYMLVNEPIMLRDILIDQTKERQEVKSNKYLEKSIVAFEFDLWMIENLREGIFLDLALFEAYIKGKYGASLDERLYAFRKYDLRHIDHLENIASALAPHYDRIEELFSLLVENNRMRIHFDDETRQRVARQEVKPAAEEEKKEEVRAETDRNSDSDCLKAEVRREVDRDYRLILKEKEERIEKLEKDIREFKRQRDESREYSVNQYDRGVKDLFALMNDLRYGKVIDYFYALLRSGEADSNLASYLDNFFMALEDMEIEPIAAEEEIRIKEETMLKEFNLGFDKADFQAEKVRLKYAGWTHKGSIMEKPTIVLKEE